MHSFTHYRHSGCKWQRNAVLPLWRSSHRVAVWQKPLMASNQISTQFESYQISLFGLPWQCLYNLWWIYCSLTCLMSWVATQSMLSNRSHYPKCDCNEAKALASFSISVCFSLVIISLFNTPPLQYLHWCLYLCCAHQFYCADDCNVDARGWDWAQFQQ